MDIRDHYRELGLEAGATHDALVKSFRRRMLQLQADAEADPKNSNIVQKRLSAADSFLALAGLSSRSRQVIDKYDTTLWLESEVFRLQRTPFRKTSMEFSPAKAPTLAVYRPNTVSGPKIGATAKPSLTAILAIGSFVALAVIVLLNLAREDRATATKPTPIRSPAVLVPIPERSTIVPAQTNQPERPSSEPSGRLRIQTNRANAVVEVIPSRGIRTIAVSRLNPTSYAADALQPGEYRITARLDGWPAIERLVTLGTDHALDVLIEFKGGSLRVDSDPSDAVVRVAERALGRTPLLLNDLPPGNLVLSLQYDAWPALQKTVVVTEGVENHESVRFPRGRLTVASSPAGAILSIDGKEFGKTPLTIDRVPVGQRTLKLHADDFHVIEVPVSISDGAELKVHPTLFSNLKTLDPSEVLNAAWGEPAKGGKKYEIAPDFDADKVSKPQNGIVRNLNRRQLDASWLRRKFKYSAAIKSYDAKTGMIEFADQNSEKSKSRVEAQLSSEERSNKSFTDRLLRGAIVEISGRLTGVEEPKWPSKTIVFELSEAHSLK